MTSYKYCIEIWIPAVEKCIMQALVSLPLIKGFKPVKKPEV